MNKTINKNLLGQKIRSLRKSRQMTQEYLSERLKIDPASLSNIENSKFLPSLTTLIKVCEVFSITPNELFDTSYLEDKDFIEKEIEKIIKNLNFEEKKFLYRFLKIISI